jgi:ubiquinone/menaquinone biosynthesis C-methylase UbiE
MALFRPGPPIQPTSVAMIGARSGDRILVVGAGDGQLAADAALAAGLNGTVQVVDRDAAAKARAESAAARAGALIEFVELTGGAPMTLPGADASFDIVVVNHAYARATFDDRARVVAEALRVVRGGGRVIVVEAGVKKRGWFRTPADTTSPGEPSRDALTAGGWRAARVLADVDGVVYVEAMKGRT